MHYSKIIKCMDLPMVGFGTSSITGYDLVNKSLDKAISCGYRLIDTAAVYGNEEDIGKSLFEDILRRRHMSRSEIFITTKLDPRFHGKNTCRENFYKSLSALQCDYIDTYLIHWPALRSLETSDPRNKDIRMESWRELETLHNEGLIRCLGVSNYTVRHLRELLEACDVKPMLNQVEYHPFLVQSDLHEFCKENGIQLQAYSSLGKDKDNELIKHKTITEIAQKYNKTPAKVLLRWALQQDIMVIPKSTNPERIRSNIELFNFTLDESDMSLITGLNRNQRLLVWDPTVVV